MKRWCGSAWNNSAARVEARVAGHLAALMDEDWEEAAATEAVAARVASDTARFLPETTPLLLAAAAKATEAAEVAASSGGSSDEEEFESEFESDIESEAHDLPEGMASYDDDDEFGVALSAPVTTLQEAAATEEAAAVRLQAAKRGQRARREVAGRRRRGGGAQAFGSMTVEDEEESSEEESSEEEEEEVHAITALRAHASVKQEDADGFEEEGADPAGEDRVAMGFLSLRRTTSRDEARG